MLLGHDQLFAGGGCAAGGVLKVLDGDLEVAVVAGCVLLLCALQVPGSDAAFRCISALIDLSMQFLEFLVIFSLRLVSIDIQRPQILQNLKLLVLLCFPQCFRISLLRFVACTAGGVKFDARVPGSPFLYMFLVAILEVVLLPGLRHLV